MVVNSGNEGARARESECTSGPHPSSRTLLPSLPGLMLSTGLLLPSPASSQDNRASSSLTLEISRDEQKEMPMPFVPKTLRKVEFQGKLVNKLIQSHGLTQSLTSYGTLASSHS